MNKIIAIIVVLAFVGGGAFIGFKMGEDKPGAVDTTTPAGGDATDAVVEPKGNVLDLSGKGLTKVTADIYDKTGTTQLILSNNSLKTLPSEMGRMTNLTVLKLDNNLLEGSLIGEVRKMSNLVTLDVSDNKMTGMPAEIGQLSKLQTLDYSNNDIDGLPNELSNLKQLKTFNLTGNPLSADKISKLKASLPNTNIIF